MVRARVQAGQYVFLLFPAVSLWEWHPFSVTSSPSDNFIEVCIRGAGNYTRSLVQYVETHPGEPLTVRVEGPYGRVPLALHQAQTVLFVVGGIGRPLADSSAATCSFSGDER